MKGVHLAAVVALSAPFALAACAKKGDDAKAAGSTPRSKADKCKQIGKEMGQLALVTAGTLAVGLGEDADSSSDAIKEAGSMARGAAAELEASCMGWSDKAVDCLVDPGLRVFDSEGCEVAVAEALGQPLPPKDVPPGPKPTWSHTFEGSPQALRLRADGMLIANLNHYQADDDGGEGTWYRALVGVKDGAEVWMRPGRFHSEIVDLGDTGYAVLTQRKLEVLDPETGKTKWTWQPKAIRPEDYDPEWMSPPEPASVRAVATEGDGLLVATSDARFYALSKDGKSAQEQFQLSDEVFGDEARLFVAADGTRWLWESYDLRAFDRQWVQKVGVRAHDSLAAVAIRDTDAVLLIDDEVMALDPKSCASTEVGAPSGWPHPGELFDPEFDECAGCSFPPPGCVKWSHYIADVAHQPMTLLDDGRVVVNDGEQTFALESKGAAWRVATAAGGRAAAGRYVFGLMPGDDESGASKLWALEPGDGKPAWLSALPSGNEGWLYSTDEVHVEAAGDWVVAGYGSSVSAFRLAP